MFGELTAAVSNSPLTYLVVLGAAAGDVLFPVIPSETIVIAAAVIAARTSLKLSIIVPAAAVGALLGDNIAYLVGDRAGEPLIRRLFHGRRARDRLRWARQAVRRRGVSVILVGRFIPGGRTAGTISAGMLDMRYRHFLPADACAATAWAVYASLLGYLGGEKFEHNFWLPLVLALGVATLAGLLIEGWRLLQRRRGKDVLGDELDR